MLHLDRRALLWPWTVVALAAVAGILVGRPGSGHIAAVLPATVTAIPPKLTVHVSGWVVDPGLVQLAEGARIAEAIEAAGGVRKGALTRGLNLAQVLVDGQQIDVPGPGGSADASRHEGKVRINQADAAALQALPGVGPVLAGRIVAHRDAHGLFQTAEDLLDVPGIGESKLDSIRDLITVP